MKIVGFVSYFDPNYDRKAWSGTIYKMREAIEQAGYRVKWIKCKPHIIIKCIVIPLLICLYGKSWMFTSIKQKIWSKSIRKKEIQDCDFLFFPGGAQMIKYLKSKNLVLPPVIYCTDACFHQMIDYYWYGIPKGIRRIGDNLEKTALEKSSLLIFSSDWARDCAVKYYGCPVNKTEILEFGANIDDNDIEPIIPYHGGTLKILFSGVEWERKGADIAIEAVKHLIYDGVDTKLYIVGLSRKKIPREFLSMSFVEYVGFFNKNNDEEYKKYIETIRNCHCLLLPSRAECSSIVLCEAAAYGLPTFTYDTGGLSNYVINGKTGYRLDIKSKAYDFAKAIHKVIDNNEMARLHEGALSYYKERINWGSWQKRFSSLMNKHFGEDMKRNNQ